MTARPLRRQDWLACGDAPRGDDVRFAHQEVRASARRVAKASLCPGQAPSLPRVWPACRDSWRGWVCQGPVGICRRAQAGCWVSCRERAFDPDVERANRIPLVDCDVMSRWGGHGVVLGVRMSCTRFGSLSMRNALHRQSRRGGHGFEQGCHLTTLLSESILGVLSGSSVASEERSRGSAQARGSTGLARRGWRQSRLGQDLLSLQR